jgi:hypothetical protein
VSADGRGNTHRGRPATLPDALYEPSIDPATAERSGTAGLIVNFRGEEARCYPPMAAMREMRALRARIASYRQPAVPPVTTAR